MTSPASVLLCPKCTAEMRSYERNGVTVDMCTSCKGIFLDRGELDRLIDAEGSFYDSGKTAGASSPLDSYRDDRGHGGHGGHDKYREDSRYGHGGKRRKGFLSELFD